MFVKRFAVDPFNIRISTIFHFPSFGCVFACVPFLFVVVVGNIILTIHVLRYSCMSLCETVMYEKDPMGYFIAKSNGMKRKMKCV